MSICFIGAGLHSFRYVYPVFQYAPVDLLAICDIQESRAKAFARQFGAQRAYTDHIEMLEKEKPDAVFIVTSYHESVASIPSAPSSNQTLSSGSEAR